MDILKELGLTESESEQLKAIAVKHSANDRATKLIEELGELTVELARLGRKDKRASLESLAEEMADVFNVGYELLSLLPKGLKKFDLITSQMSLSLSSDTSTPDLELSNIKWPDGHCAEAFCYIKWCVFTLNSKGAAQYDDDVFDTSFCFSGLCRSYVGLFSHYNGLREAFIASKEYKRNRYANYLDFQEKLKKGDTHEG